MPIGAFWIREPHADLLGPGSHGSTYGGTPLACAAALKVLEVIQRDGLDRNARELGVRLKEQLAALAVKHPALLREVRGLGLMIGIEFAPKENIPALARGEKPVSLQMVERLHAAGLLTIPAGTQVVRLLPPLNITPDEADEALALLTAEVEKLATG